MDAGKDIRLSGNVIPFKYELLIEPNMHGEDYQGREVIYATAREPTKAIRLNAKSISIKEAKVSSGSQEHEAFVSYFPEREEAELNLDKEVSGSISIKMHFSGKHNESLFGFYRSNYTAKGVRKSILTTQFEPTGARLAFPCFDEPAMKAVFEVSLLIDPNLEAISNMPVRSEEMKGRKKLVMFMPTPKMSTYLVYLGVGTFDRMSGWAGKTRLSVVTVPGKASWGGLALRYAKSFIRFYESYFGIAYQLPKLDLIAVPDFAAGAMENWGAITFREVELLAEPKTTSTSTMQRIAEVVAHELAHQWFGDLVTLAWWDDTWLNESFATFMSYKAIGSVFPAWDAEAKYLDQEVSRGFASDDFLAAHPVSVHVSDPAHAGAMFDDISYRKGGALLLMFNDYVGEAIFRGGLRRYLKKHSYSNASKEELWSAIDDFASTQGRRTRLHNIASKWIESPGHPTVFARENKAGITLKQRRLTLLKNLNARPWPIPIRYTSSNGKPTSRLLMLTREKAELRGKTKVKLNFGQAGFYRVGYSNRLLDYAGTLAKMRKVSGKDIWGIENDLFFFLRSGRLPLNKYLDYIARYLPHAGYPANSNISSHLSWLYSITDGYPVREKIKEAGISYHLTLLNRLGWKKTPGEKTYDTAMRNSALLWLGTAGEHKTLKFLTEKFARNKQIDPEIRSAVYISVAQNGGRNEFAIIKERYNVSNSPEEKRILLAALGNFNNTSLIESSLRFAMSKNVRLQDSIFIPIQTSKTALGRKLLLKWQMANWHKLMELYDPSANMLSGLTLALSTQADADARNKIVRFFSNPKNLRGDIERDVKIAIESIDANIKVLAANT